MLDINDFNQKQTIFVFITDGDSISYSNDNLVIKSKDNKIKGQVTCYRLFSVFIVGHTKISTGLIYRAKKFGFSIVLMNSYFKPYQVIDCKKEGNTLLKQHQYHYNDIDIAKHIVLNKLKNQKIQLNGIRNKSEMLKEDINKIDGYCNCVNKCKDIYELMGYEGLAAKLYFKNFFMGMLPSGRKPRVKCDITNAILDIGYTLLFSYIESILDIYGFDTYCGVLHKQFYMRKSLVCDIIEPFRVIIDLQVKKSLNLNQFKQKDFKIYSGRYELDFQQSKQYIQVLLNPILDNKEKIFRYIQQYYRCFMKQKEISDYPEFLI